MPGMDESTKRPNLQTDVPHLASGQLRIRLLGGFRVRVGGRAVEDSEWRLGKARAVAEICGRLDGLPLAIELAAAKVRSMSPDRIAQQLHDSLRLLTDGSRTATPRQRTLRGALEWSMGLMSEPERALFRTLGVFAGGWTAESPRE